MTTRQRIAIALGAVLALVGAFSVGRFTAPREVETRVEWRDLSTQELTKGMNFTRVVTRVVRRDVVTTITDAGTTITDRSIEREGDDTAARETETAKRTDSSEGVQVRTVTVQPAWRVALQAGASLREPAIPLTGPLVLGVQVEHRIAGGVSAGVWANTVGAAGVSLSAEF